MFWCKKEPSIIELSAAQAQIKSSFYKEKRRIQRQQTLLESILSATSKGHFNIRFEGPKYVKFYAHYTPGILILQIEDITYLKSLGYKVENKLEKRSSLILTNNRFELEDYEYYEVSW